MKKNILWLAALLLPFMGLVSSCSNDDDIVFDHEQPMFEIQPGKILLEVILPAQTTQEEEVYIAGAFNGGDEVAVGDAKWALQRTELSTIKRGIYLDPNDFVSGKGLADGYHFVSATQRNEVTVKNDTVVRTETFGVGTRTNIYVDRWAAYYDKADEGDDEPDYYIPYLESADEESVFFETDAEYVRIWAWGGDVDQSVLIGTTKWDERPWMELVGQTADGKNVFKYVFGGAPTNFLVSESDADGNQIGSDDDRPIKGAVYTKNGYYIKGHVYDGDGAELPQVITQVGKPVSGAFVPYLDSADEESVFFETDAEYVRIWAWGGDVDQSVLIGTTKWDERPWMELVGKTKDGKNVFKYVFGGAPNNFLVSESDADGNQIGSDDDRPIKGAVYTKNGYYIKGHVYDGDDAETPDVITKIGK